MPTDSMSKGGKIKHIYLRELIYATIDMKNL
jgi:hypothetical protein